MRITYNKNLIILIVMMAFTMRSFAIDHDKQSSQKLVNVLLESIALMDVSYHWGGNTPASGLDCSGFVHYVFKKALGVNLPRTAASIAKVGKSVNLSNLQPGDLLFFNTDFNRNYLHISHIGIYLGDNQFIQAPHTGEQIQITQFMGYWRSHFVLAKRITSSTLELNHTQHYKRDLHADHMV